MTKYSFITLIIGLLTGAIAPVMAGDAASDGNSGSFYIPEAQRRFSDAQGCVEPTDEMRANHMEYILDQRDATVHEGIRTKQYSLVECINCHVSDAPDAPRYESEKHFCNSCHTYTSVSIDCFQCHADRPVKTPGYQPPLSRINDGRAHVSDDADEVTSERLQVIANEGTGNE
jgi:hypothetical protein